MGVDESEVREPDVIDSEQVRKDAEPRQHEREAVDAWPPELPASARTQVNLHREGRTIT